MKRITAIVCLCLALCGCSSILDGSYHSVTPHEDQGSHTQSNIVAASDYQMLRSVMEDLVAAGTTSAVINVTDYDQSLVDIGINNAARYVQTEYPLGAYAVESIEYEIGLSGGIYAISVDISYIHGRSELRKIQTVEDPAGAETALGVALEGCDTGLVLLIEHYEETDFAQLVSDYADENPHKIMETPQVAVGLYPEEGESRVVELAFTYQNSRDSLRAMQNQVQPVFSAATLYVSGEGSDNQKYVQLYAFLTERFDYTLETSITPAYSLLRHGVGDSKAFAMVYSAMCRQAGLTCHIITGTRNGDPWYWNMICDNDRYYHVDLLQSSAAGRFTELTDAQMTGYVWDYSAYPEASGQAITAEPSTEAPTAPSTGE